VTYKATVHRVLIASPRDVTEERSVIADVLLDWNAAHSVRTASALVAVMWETHTTPEMGQRPQEIINRQIVRDCDLLVGAFWTRIGTATGAAVSGTVEEIQEFRKAGKPVMLYFSNAPVSLSEVDQDQYTRLVTFKDECRREGIVEIYETAAEFREKLTRQLAITLGSLLSQARPEASLDVPRRVDVGHLQAVLGELEYNLTVSASGDVGGFTDDQFRRATQE